MPRSRHETTSGAKAASSASLQRLGVSVPPCLPPLRKGVGAQGPDAPEISLPFHKLVDAGDLIQFIKAPPNVQVANPNWYIPDS
eukprot:11210772-Lingulodinium_polyedra.AAC.2